MASPASGASTTPNLVFNERQLPGVEALEVERDESGWERSGGEDEADDGSEVEIR